MPNICMYNTQTDPLFCKLKIVKVPDIVDYNCGTFMHKLTNHLLPTSFYSTFPESTQESNHTYK